MKGCPSLNVWRTPHRAANWWNFGSFPHDPQCLIIYNCISSTHGLRKFWLSPGRTSVMLWKNLYWLNRTQIPPSWQKSLRCLECDQMWVVSQWNNAQEKGRRKKSCILQIPHPEAGSEKKNVLYIGFKISLSRAYVYSDPCSVRETKPYLTKMYSLSPESVRPCQTKL